MRRLSILAAVLGLILAACGGGDGEAETSTTIGAETTTTAGSEPTTTASPDTTTTAAEQTTTTAAVVGGGGSSCIEGQWIFGSENFVEAMRTVMSETEMAGAEVEAIDGTYLVMFGSDGSFTGERTDWGFSVVSADGTVVISMSGTEEGTWSADDSAITVSIASSDVNVSARVESDGQTFELPNSPVDVPETIAESSAYQCDSSTLSVTTDEFTFTLDRA